MIRKPIRLGGRETDQVTLAKREWQRNRSSPLHAIVPETDKDESIRHISELKPALRPQFAQTDSKSFFIVGFSVSQAQISGGPARPPQHAQAEPLRMINPQIYCGTRQRKPLPLQPSTKFHEDRVKIALAVSVVE
jgi:hypothetical protein